LLGVRSEKWEKTQTTMGSGKCEYEPQSRGESWVRLRHERQVECRRNGKV
jgi:hypothetical protein